MDLRALGRARPLAAPVADDEGEERAFDEDEDHPGEDEDEEVRVFDPVCGGRMRCRRQQPAVACEGGLPQCERARERQEQEDDSPTHAEWHRIKGGESLAG